MPAEYVPDSDVPTTCGESGACESVITTSTEATFCVLQVTVVAHVVEPVAIGQGLGLAAMPPVPVAIAPVAASCTGSLPELSYNVKRNWWAASNTTSWVPL